MTDPASRFTVQWDAVDPFDPAYPHLWIKVEHLGRYLFAADYLQEAGVETVLDVGSGTGYGGKVLGRELSRVICLDARNSKADAGENVQFVQHKVGTAPLRDIPSIRHIDAIVCFETLEHLIDPERALHEFAELQAPGGTLILSVPNGSTEGIRSDGLLTNALHRRAFSVSSLSSLLTSARYDVREVLGQQLASDISTNETRLIRRNQLENRIGDEPALHRPEMIEHLARVIGYPEPRDVERSYSLIVIAERASDMR